MKRFLILSGLGAMLAATSQAAITTYTDLSAFLSAVSGTNCVEDFNSNVSTCSTFTLGGTTGSFRGFTGGERRDHVSSGGATTTISSSVGDLAGMFANWDLSLGGAGQSIIIRLNLVGGGTEDVPVVLGAGTGGFGGPFNFGFTSTNAFTSVTLVNANGPANGIGESFEMDNLVLAGVADDNPDPDPDPEPPSSVPEPSTFGLMGLALVGVGAFRRIRK